MGRSVQGALHYLFEIKSSSGEALERLTCDSFLQCSPHKIQFYIISLYPEMRSRI